MRQLRCALGTAGALVALVSLPARAQDAAANAAPFTLRTSIKAGALAFRAPDAPALFPERNGGESLWRVRFEPEVRAGSNVVFALGYEQRLRYSSDPSGIATLGVLPPDAAAPFRVRALDWNLAASASTSWRHEIDRANVQLTLHRAHLTIGRQAVGWGRGVMFGAVDLFAPFSPLEADREWRRGIDAIRSDIKLTDRSSVDLVGAFGRTADTSVFAARARGYAGRLDLEVMGGRRARDTFGGVTASAAVGDAELHGELALFRVPSDLTGPGSDIVYKAVVGGSYRFPLGAGILAYAEYHYSGFGATRPEDIATLLARPGFLERYLRGDMQILSRHAVAVIGTYEASPELSYAGQWLHNPLDGSGVVAPGVTYTLSDAVSLLGTVYIPYGRAPRALELRSEFGAAALSGLLQLRLYL